jgi:hypothetical protein
MSKRLREKCAFPDAIQRKITSKTSVHKREHAAEELEKLEGPAKKTAEEYQEDVERSYRAIRRSKRIAAQKSGS